MTELAFVPSGDQLLKLALATLLGAAIGLERELRGNAAGLRTMILVCVGSALAMVVSNELTMDVGRAGTPVDPSRIAAGIVTGVGFLGAGVIIRLGDLVRGVTTAAAVWFVAALGLAVGSGHFGFAVCSAVVALLVLAVLSYPERFMKSQMYRTVTVVTQSKHASKVLEDARSLLERERRLVLDVLGSRDLRKGIMSIEFQVRAIQGQHFETVVDSISQLEGVEQVSWKVPPR